MYVMFVIAAILLSASPMHAHTLVAAILPAGAPVQHLAAAELAEPRHQAPATRPKAHQVPVPPVFPVKTIAAVLPASPAPAAPLADVSLLQNAPNAP